MLKRGKSKTLLAIALIVLALLGIVASLLLTRTTQIQRLLAWDCSAYIFTVDDDGVVTIHNGSTKVEPAQKATVYVNGSQVGDFKVPALRPGQSEVIGTVPVPEGEFEWEVKGSKDCGNDNKDHKILICHVPPGNPENAQAIEIDRNAWEQGHSPHNTHDMDFVIEGNRTCPPPKTFECPLQAGAGEYLVRINGNLRSDSSEDWAMHGPIDFDIPSGFYDVTLVSADDHSDKSDGDEPAESYYLQLLDDGGQRILDTSPIADLPKNQDTLIQQVNFGLEIGTEIGQIIAKHTAYPSSTPNTVTALCALFSPAEPPINAQCLDLKVYDTAWNRINASDLSSLKAGDIVRFSVSASTTLGSIDKARFTINGGAPQETTTKRPGTDEFYYEYTIPQALGSFSVKAELLHSRLGWF